MIVAMALKKVFDGKTIKVGQDDVSVQFHFGDQKEFNFWVAEKMRVQQQKYPLIWYVIAPHERLANGKIRVDSQLYLFFGNKETSMMNDKRFSTSYLNYLEPTYKMVNETLRKNPYTTLLNGTKFLPDYDEPNFGVESSDDLDFKNTTERGKKSATIDFVDAKILKLKMEISPNCILI